MVDLAKLAKGAATSRTLYGGVSLFTMLVGNVRIKLDMWVFETHYVYQDASLIAAVVALAFVAWGRLKAKGPLLTDKPDQPAAMGDEQRGFLRA